METNKCLKFLYMFVFWSSSINFDIPYSEKFGKNRWKKISAENFGKWSAKSLLILTTNLDDFSSENCWWFVHYKLYGSKLYVFIQICIHQIFNFRKFKTCNVPNNDIWHFYLNVFPYMECPPSHWPVNINTPKRTKIY